MRPTWDPKQLLPTSTNLKTPKHMAPFQNGSSSYLITAFEITLNLRSILGGAGAAVVSIVINSVASLIL